MEYLVTFFFLMAAHYVDFDHLVPWRMPHPARMVMNYVIGTVGILAPFMWKLHERGEYELMLELSGFVLAAGLATILAYLNDGLKNLKQTARENRALSEAYKAQRNEQITRKQ